ncbi:hypothetical protein DRJ16_05950 [Candidatus Woesearchaeota archaeon]|nr:MAG: hypothetical protein DRJ16_05950 [Candidatus Woesearchaeota archaeon]
MIERIAISIGVSIMVTIIMTLLLLMLLITIPCGIAYAIYSGMRDEWISFVKYVKATRKTPLT